MTEDPESSEAQHPTWVQVTQKVLALLYIVAGASFFIAIGPTVGIIRRGIDWDNELATVVLVTVLVAMPLALVSGIGLGRGSEWGYHLGRLTALVPAIGAALGLVHHPDLYTAVLVAVLFTFGGLLAGFLSIPPLRQVYRPGVEETPWEINRPLVRHVLVLTLGLVVLGLTMSELPQIVKSLRHERQQSQCEETGEADACGPLAQRLLSHGETVEEWKRGYEIKTDLCEKGVGVACRRLGYLHSFVRAHTEDEAKPLLAHIDRVAFEACLNSDSRGCMLVRLNAKRSDTSLGDDEYDRVFKTSLELCEQGDIWACRTVFSFAMTEEKKRETGHVSAADTLCKDGFVFACAQEDIVQDEQENENTWDACRHDVDIETCFTAHYNVPKHPHRKVIVGVLNWLGDGTNYTVAVENDIGLWGLKPFEIEGLNEACDDDVAEACLALGVNAAADRRGQLLPELDRIADYDRTFFRACELGMNAGCLAYAERLLNRPLGEERRVDRAHKALRIACERDDERACWLLALNDTPESVDEDTYEAALIRACKAQKTEFYPRAPCRELTFYWAHQMGATPWLFSERLSRARLKEHCLGKQGRWSCAGLSWARPEKHKGVLDTSLPPWHIQTFSTAMRSCKKKNEWACEHMFRIARDYPVHDEDEVNELRQRVCKVFPGLDVC